MGSSPSAPTDLRPSLANRTIPHKSYRCFYLRQRAGALHHERRESSDSMIEAGGPSTSEFQECYLRSVVPAPPGVVMFSPPEVPRNASRGKGKGHAKEVFKKRGRGQYRGRYPVESPGQRQLLLRHLDGNLKDLIRDTERLTVALEYHESLTQGCAGSQRRVKLPRPKD
jgi:hypothetical protein